MVTEEAKFVSCFVLGRFSDTEDGCVTFIRTFDRLQKTTRRYTYENSTVDSRLGEILYILAYHHVENVEKHCVTSPILTINMKCNIYFI